MLAKHSTGGGITTSPHRRRRPKTIKQKTDADDQPSQQSNSHIPFPHWPRPPPSCRRSRPTQLPPPSRTRCTIRNLSRDPCHSISHFKAATMPQLPKLNPKRARLAARIALMRRESSLKPHEGAETRDTFAVKARLALGEKSWRAIP